MRWNSLITSVFATSLICGSVTAQAAKGALEVVQSAPLNYTQVLQQAQNANPQAQLQLGLAFSRGAELPRDDAKARQWLALAAAQGLDQAQYQLALMFQYGQGQQPDFDQAKHYYQQAASQGHAEAQYALGRLYLIADSDDKNPVKAWTWLALAADNGLAGVAGIKDMVAQTLSPSELSTAKQALTQLKGKQGRKQSLMVASIGQ